MTVYKNSVHSWAACNDYGFGVFLGPLSSLLLALPASISFWGSSNLSIIDKVSEMPLLCEKTLWSLCPCSSLEGCRWVPLASWEWPPFVPHLGWNQGVRAPLFLLLTSTTNTTNTANITSTTTTANSTSTTSIIILLSSICNLGIQA